MELRDADTAVEDLIMLTPDHPDDDSSMVFRQQVIFHAVTRADKTCHTAENEVFEWCSHAQGAGLGKHVCVPCASTRGRMGWM